MEKIKKFYNDKKVLLIVGLFVIIIFTVMYSRFKINRAVKLPLSDNQNEYIAPSFPPLTQAAQLNKAIQEQQNVDHEYANWQETSRAEYPWINKMPLYSEKYFVYFDLEKKVFIGKLYPQLQDNVDELKLEIQNKLRSDLEVPLENYIVNWNILPQ